jgi:hypothetical protein
VNLKTSAWTWLGRPVDHDTYAPAASSRFLRCASFASRRLCSVLRYRRLGACGVKACFDMRQKQVESSLLGGLHGHGENRVDKRVITLARFSANASRGHPIDSAIRQVEPSDGPFDLRELVLNVRALVERKRFIRLACHWPQFWKSVKTSR